MVLQTQTGSLQTYGAVEAAGPGVVIPDARLLFTADFSRAGHDLVLTGSEGAKFIVTGYFNSDTPPSLISPEGAKLTGDVVTALSGPQFPGQYAQAGDAASGKQAIGKVESSSGSASAVRADGTTVTLKAGDPVFQGDVVLTGPGSKLGISFVDGTIFSLTANARMVLNSLVYDPDGGKSNSMLFSLVEGSFVFAAGQIAPTGDMKIQTPVATMGIRGTAPTVDIVAGLTHGGVVFSIIPNPDDGHVGSYTLCNLDTGLPIGTVSSVGTKWQLTSAQGQILELDKTEADLLNDANAVGQINNIYSQWLSSTQQNTDGPQAGPQNSSPPSGGMNTNPQNPDAPGGEGIDGNNGDQGQSEGQNDPQGNTQQSTTPPLPPPTDTGSGLPPINSVPVITGDTTGDVTEDATEDVTGDGDVTEDGTLTATGTLNVADADAGDSGTQTQNNTAGAYGSFSVDANGNWTYVLDNTNADVQGLYAGQTLTETFDVTSIDGSATETVTVTINGAPGDTIITGDDNANVLNGTSGDNIINALGGRDFIFASAGNDIVDGGADIDTMFYTSTGQGIVIDLVTGTVTGPQTGTDTVTGVENFIAGSGNDRIIIGEDGPIFFNGGDGIDTIEFFGNLNIDTSTTLIEADNIEIIDLNKTHDNILTISAEDVENDDGEGILQIRGGPGDTLNLTNEFDFGNGNDFGFGFGWQLAEGPPVEIDGLLFDVYQFVDGNGTVFATAHVEQGIDVNAQEVNFVLPAHFNGALGANDSASNDVPASGNNFNSPNPDVSDYWTFFATAGQVVTVQVARDEPALDPALWLFSGLAGDPAGFGFQLDSGDPGFIAFADDQIPHPGPFGDPTATFVAPTTGFYTAIVTNFLSGADDGDGVFPYTIQVSGNSPLPADPALIEGFENGFAANGWETINATISSDNSTEGNFSAHLTTTTGNESGPPDGGDIIPGDEDDTEDEDFIRDNVVEIAELINVDLDTLDSLAETPDSPGFATEGSAIATSFFGMEGQILSFDWFFSTYEYVEDDDGVVNDFAFVVIDGEAIRLFDAEASENQMGNMTTEGWNKFTMVLDESGNHDIAFGVLDNEDNAVESSLNIDNIQLVSSDDIPHLMGGPGNDIIVSGDGNNIITTGQGADRIIFGNLEDGIDLITDFGSQDTLDLTGLLDDVFDPESDNIEDFVRASTNTLTGETTVAVDIDGPGGPAQFADIAVLQGIGADFDIKVSIGDEDASVTSAAITV